MAVAAFLVAFVRGMVAAIGGNGGMANCHAGRKRRLSCVRVTCSQTCEGHMFPDRMFPYITLLSSPGGMPRSSQAAFCKEENSSITAVLESERGGSAGHGKMRKKNHVGCDEKINISKRS